MRTKTKEISQKIPVTIGILLTFNVATILYFGNFGIHRLEIQNQTYTDQLEPESEDLIQIQSSANTLTRFIWLALAQDKKSTERKTALDTATEHLGLLQMNMAKLAQYSFSDVEKPFYHQMKDTLPFLSEAFESVKTSILAGSESDDENARETASESLTTYSLKTATAAKDLTNQVSLKKQTLIDERKAQTHQSKIIFAALNLSLSLFSFLLTWIAVRRTQYKNVNLINETHSFEPTMNTATFNDLAVNLATTPSVATPATVTELVASTVTQGTEGAHLNDQAVKETPYERPIQNEWLTQIQNTLSEYTDFIGGNLVHTETQLQMVQDTVESAQKKNNGTISHTGSDTTQSLNTNLECFDEILDEIFEKTKTLEHIVFKTQLLSINASVEAERAGEQGKSFGVIASELNKLVQFSESTESEITQLVKSLQKTILKGNFQKNDSIRKSTNNLDEDPAQDQYLLSEESVDFVKKSLRITQRNIQAYKEQLKTITQLGHMVEAKMKLQSRTPKTTLSLGKVIPISKESKSSDSHETLIESDIREKA